MARKPRSSKAKGAVARPGVRAGNNDFEGDVVREFLDRLLELDAQAASEMGAAMKAVRGIRGEQDIVFEEADAAGIPKKALRAHLKVARLEKQMDKIREKLEPAAQDDFDKLSQALGHLEGTPLGRAAVEREQGRPPAAEESNVVPLAGREPEGRA